MTREEIRLFVHRYKAAMERADLRALMACYADGAAVDSPIFHVISGRAAIEKSFGDLFQGLTDWSIALDDIVIDTEGGDRAVMLTTVHVTHKGFMFGFPGTGRRLALRTSIALRFEDGLIASELRVYDFTGLLVQIGVLKAKGG